MTKSLAVTPRGGLAAWVGSRYNPKALVSMMDCTCQTMCKAKGVHLRVSQGGLPWFWVLQKGGHTGSRRRAVIGLDLLTGPHTKEV